MFAFEKDSRFECLPAHERRQGTPDMHSFVGITLEARGGHDTVLVPVAAAEPMRRKTSCDACRCRCSYIGAAYFCPSCGKNSPTQTFAQTLGTARKAATMGATLRETLGPDDAEVMTRTLLEKAMQDTVMSFQRLFEQLYEAKPGKTAGRNAFQNLDIGSGLWRPVLDTDYEGLVAPRK